MYSFESKIRYSELSSDGCLSLEGLVNYFQDCACFESEELGLGIGTAYARKRTWVLNFWQIVIDRYPEMGEQMTIATQACGSEKIFGYRNFMMTDGQGAMAAKAYSVWTLIDMVKGRPCMIQSEDIDAYGSAPPLPMETVPRKIPVPKDGALMQEAFGVREYHLDTNHHVNNVQYVRMATAYLPQDACVRELRVEYKRQAVLGDEIQPVLYRMEDGYLVVLYSADEKIFAIVRFIL